MGDPKGFMTHGRANSRQSGLATSALDASRIMR